MATTRLFRLKAQRVPAPLAPIAGTNPVAQIQVDTGVFHLDQLFEYWVPEALTEVVSPGVRVQVPFNGRETEGIIVSRSAMPMRGGELKSVTKVLSPHPVVTDVSLNLFIKAAELHCCNPWDLIRSAIPPRVASVDKELQIVAPSKNSFGTEFVKVFQNFSPYIPAQLQISAMLKDRRNSGSVLIVAPDEKDVDLLYAQISKTQQNVLKLTGNLPREERYRNFLLAMRMDISIIIGTRSAVFCPIKNLQTIIIYKESSPDHYETRSPGWNTSSIAQLRTKIEGLQLIYTGFAPSMRSSYEIDQGLMKYRNIKEEVTVKAFTPQDGSLLPGKIYSEIRKSLQQGPVLFISPRKGYGNAVLCAHCRNVATCTCGGRLAVAAKSESPHCVHCGTTYPKWKCNFCGRDRQYLAARGIDRSAEEISRAFPGFPVVISSGDVIKRQVEAKPSLVLSTPGAQPMVDDGYSAVVLLEGTKFFSHTDIASQERARELFFETSSMISRSGKVLLVIDEAHPIYPALARWNLAPLLKRELAERQALSLPPVVASAVIVTDQQAAPQISAGLRKALSEGRLPQSLKIFGPTVLPKNQAKIVLHAPHNEWDQVAKLLHELQRKRSIAKKDLFNLRINPYSL